MSISLVADQLNAQVYINDLVEFNGKMYAGTSPGGRLFEWNQLTSWVQFAPQLGTQSHIVCLAVYNGELYAGTGSGGHLYKWDNISAWVQVIVAYPATSAISKLIVFNNKLYAVLEGTGVLLEFDDVNAWIVKAANLNSQYAVLSVLVHNNELYAATSFGGYLYKWDNISAWVPLTNSLGFETIRGLATFKGDIFACTQISGNVYKWNNVNDWRLVADVVDNQSLYTMLVYQNELYFGSGDLGNLYKLNESQTSLLLVDQAINSQNIIYKLIEYKGNLYAGTGSTGNLFKYSFPLQDKLERLCPQKKRTLADYTGLLFQFLPIGRLWESFNQTWNLFLEAVAEEYNRNDQRNVDLQCEMIPGLSMELLEHWEKDVLLPDEYPDETTTLSERQTRVHTKLFNTPNNPTRVFWEKLALDRGVVINISSSGGAFRVGVNRVGDRIQGSQSNFIWIVDYVSGSKTEYIALEATFRKLSPAWQLLIFNAPPP